jgi:hypothetical protein
VSTNASDPKTPTPVVEWPREWLPVRVTIAAGAASATGETGAARVVYSWRHPDFPVTCNAFQHEEVAIGSVATLPLFFESQTVRAVACARGERASNETVVRVVVSRYPGVFIAAATLTLMVLGGAVVGAVFTSLCLPDGSSFYIPSFLASVYPTFTVAFTGAALFDFLTVGEIEPVAIIAAALGMFGLANSCTSCIFFRRDVDRQRQADFRFRRWSDKHQFEHGILSCCATACGIGCVKLLYNRFLRLWPFSPDFKPPPGFVPSDIGAGGVQAKVAAAGGSTTEGVTVGGGELDAAANPKESYHLDSPIPPHADWRLDLFQAVTIPLLHIPLLVFAIILELRLLQLPWLSPQAVLGLIGFHGLGFLVWLWVLYRVCTVPSRERFAKRRRFRALMEGRSTAGSSRRDSDRDSERDSDRDSERERQSKRLSSRGSGGRKSKRDRGIPSAADLARVDPNDLEAYQKAGPGQPRLLFVQADKEARKELSKLGAGAATGEALPGGVSPRLGVAGRNAVLTERRFKVEGKKLRAQERQARKLRSVPSAEVRRIAEEQAKESEAQKALRQAREKAEEQRAREDRIQRRWQRATGIEGYGNVEPQQAEAAEAFNMRLQKKVQVTKGAKVPRGLLGGVLDLAGVKQKPPEPKLEDALEVEVVKPIETVTLPGGGKVRSAAKRRVVSKPAITVGVGRDRRTIKVSPDSPRALEAAARQKVDFDDAVKMNPFHPLHNAPDQSLAPAGRSKVRDALRQGRKEGEALPIPAAARGRRRSVELPGAGKVRTAGDTAVAVLASSGAVSRAAADAVDSNAGGHGAAVGRSVAAQTLALRRLAEQGRADLVPSAKRRGSDEDSFDDDL